MTPVDMGITASGEMPRGPATMRCVSWHRAIPSSPVQALACPELAMIALALPKRLRISLQTITGAALKTLSVNRPGDHGIAVGQDDTEIIAALALKPAAAVPALNPRGRSLFFIVSIKTPSAQRKEHRAAQKRRAQGGQPGRKEEAEVRKRRLPPLC